MPDMKMVYSSTVDSIGYDPDTQEVHVKWQSGKVSVYSDVPPSKAFEVMNAPSVGKAIHEMLKPDHDHEYR